MKQPPRQPVLVSACLLGLDTRYNGVCKKNMNVLNVLAPETWTIIPVCPEQLAGLPTPRPESGFAEGDGQAVLAGTGSVTNLDGRKITDYFIKGAEQTLQIARLNNCKLAILKERSPSCGVHQIYRNRKTTTGQGVTTAMLSNNGITVFNEDELDRFVNN